MGSGRVDTAQEADVVWQDRVGQGAEVTVWRGASGGGSEACQLIQDEHYGSPLVLGTQCLGKGHYSQRQLGTIIFNVKVIQQVIPCKSPDKTAKVFGQVLQVL